MTCEFTAGLNSADAKAMADAHWCAQPQRCGQVCDAKAAAVGEADERAVLEKVTLKLVPVVHPGDIDANKQPQQEVVVTVQWVG